MAADLPVPDELTVDVDAALLIGLEEVDAAQQGRLAGAARPDHADDLARRDIEIDTPQNVQIAEKLVHAGDL